MKSFVMAWRLFELISIFAFPLLLGILLYYRLRWAPRWLAVITASLAPAIFFFWLAPIYFFAGLRQAYASGKETCGMPALAATMLVFFGTAIELFLGLTTQAVLATIRSRRKVVAS
jgi:hypothetical protein